MKTIILIACLFVAGNAVAWDEDYFSYQNYELRNIDNNLSAIRRSLEDEAHQRRRDALDDSESVSSYKPDSPEEEARRMRDLFTRVFGPLVEKAFKRAYWDARLKLKDIR